MLGVEHLAHLHHLDRAAQIAKGPERAPLVTELLVARRHPEAVLAKSAPGQPRLQPPRQRHAAVARVVKVEVDARKAEAEVPGAE